MSIATAALAVVLAILIVTVLAMIARKPGSSRAKPATDGGPGSEAPTGRKAVQTDGGPGSEIPPK